ncbi:MAG: response regulator transcription factor [Ectothiorhodospiraceae bacterium]|nr:response regulator transcription factor [Ectothiorhodospiraceae bacterium]
MRILLVEDNARLRTLVAEGLSQAGMTVDALGTAREAAGALATVRYDAGVLDLGLPDGDGMAVLREARERGLQTPLLLLTARDGLSDRVGGLNAGADDYLTKPFAMAELVARLKALMRRPGGALGVTLGLGNVAFDTVAREASVDGVAMPMSRRETDLLEHLLRRAGRVVAKAALEDAVYGFDDELASNGLEVAIHRLRKRLQGAGADVRIHTLRGVGYMLRA